MVGGGGRSARAGKAGKAGGRREGLLGRGHYARAYAREASDRPFRPSLGPRGPLIGSGGPRRFQPACDPSRRPARATFSSSERDPSPVAADDVSTPALTDPSGISLWRRGNISATPQPRKIGSDLRS